ncbi:AraC family transcriptional regulator [Roseomonas sp. NAR14]|uniref:AraC family transcriptional regulator n=1 Tax=Roseomonas acroporae TaxID=2937791 RepID=A0A9X1YAU6_9PROT|nr:AraC family transcriptional regulator [Roseomonas acroporae]MCK8786708.1 AraC family transcriptional regulator [Roseomonas acroporae]
MDPGAALRQAGIVPEATLDPEGRVAVERFEALSAHAMRELDDEALGWFSRRLPWGSYGMLLRASLPSPTLDVALRRWCRHHGLLTGDVRLELRVEGRDAVVTVQERSDLGALREFCLVSLLRNLHGVACWLVDSRIALGGVWLPFAAPAHAGLYRHMFHAEAGFDAAAADLRFDAAYLALPVGRDDAGLRRLLQQPLPLMSRQYRQDRLLSRRIAGFVGRGDGGTADLGQIAAAFGISVRHLQRQLRNEGTSVGALVAGARRRRAEELLLQGDLPLKRIARLLGYSDESTFGRAFLRWTGRSPAAFRKGEAVPADGAGRNGAGRR